MQHFRRITSMQEDFEKIGILREANRDYHGFANEAPDVEEDCLGNSLQEDDSLDPRDLEDLTEDTSIDGDLDDLLGENEESERQALTEDLDEDFDPEDLILDEDEDNSLDLLDEEAAIDEVLKRQRLRRRKPGERAAARRNYRKNRAKLLRTRKRREKKSSFKLRQKRLSALRGTKKAGPRKRFVLNSLSESFFSTLEDLQEFDFEFAGNVHDELERGFDNVQDLAGTLTRKFAIAEEILHEADIPVEHPESEYDYDEDPDNIKDGGKTGDATDSAKDAPKGNIKHGDDHPDHATPKGNVKFEADDYDDDDDDDDDDKKKKDMDSDAYESKKESLEGIYHVIGEYDDSEEEDDDDDDKDMDEAKLGAGGKFSPYRDWKGELSNKADAVMYVDKLGNVRKMGKRGPGKAITKVCGRMARKGSKSHHGSDIRCQDGKVLRKGKPKNKKEEQIDMPSELTLLKLEAQDAMDQLKTHTISPQEAGSILRDMVTFLGGTMKAYLDLTKGISKYAYAGLGASQPETYSVSDNSTDTGHNYIGQDDVDTEAGSPEEYRQRT